MGKRLPSLFIGCSTEARDAAEALQSNLRHYAFPVIWSQNTFRLSEDALDSLITATKTHDFAAFVLAANDVRTMRGKQALVPRDNVIFEAGLFMGQLGPSRVFLVTPRDVKVELPTDLLGITTADYAKPPPRHRDKWEAALGHASNMIKDGIERQPSRTPARKKSEEQLKVAAQYFHDLLKKRYGVSVALNSWRTEIKDLSGAAVIRRGMRGIKVVREGAVKMDSFAGMVAPGAPGGKITKYPTLLDQRPKFHKDVKIRPKVKRPDYFLFDIVVKGSLTSYDGPLSFEHESEVSKLCLMTQEEVEAAYRGSDFPYEFAALRIELPSDKALIEVVFPEGFSPPEVNAGVFFGDSESLHESELHRVRRGFKKTRRGARFSITNPVVGFNYLIAWMPPPRKIFDKLKAGK